LTKLDFFHYLNTKSSRGQGHDDYDMKHLCKRDPRDVKCNKIVAVPKEIEVLESN